MLTVVVVAAVAVVVVDRTVVASLDNYRNSVMVELGTHVELFHTN